MSGKPTKSYVVERKSRRESGADGSRNIRSSRRKDVAGAAIDCTFCFALNFYRAYHFLQPAAGVVINFALSDSSDGQLTTQNYFVGSRKARTGKARTPLSIWECRH